MSSLCSDTPIPKTPVSCDVRLEGQIHNSMVLTPSWHIGEGRIYKVEENLVMHPYTYCSILARYVSSDFALTQLNKFLHERIDQLFGKV